MNDPGMARLAPAADQVFMEGVVLHKVGTRCLRLFSGGRLFLPYPGDGGLSRLGSCCPLRWIPREAQLALVASLCLRLGLITCSLFVSRNAFLHLQPVLAAKQQPALEHPLRHPGRPRADYLQEEGQECRRG